MQTKNQRISVVTLGCSKNIVDSEFIMRQLQASNFQVMHNSNDKVDIVLINTCGFIGDAKEESIAMILKYAEEKQQGHIQKLFVFGCLSERYRLELETEIPEVDGFFGVNEFKSVVQILGAKYRSELLGERMLTTPSHYAFLKISEGCSWGCSYCAIPLIRGKHLSRTVEQLVQEAEKLATAGVKELIVIAQDTTFYGMDLYGKRRISELLNQLSTIAGIEWIRLHYAFPYQFPDDLIDTIALNPKICSYLDIPFQHISDIVLKNMHRGISKADTYDLIGRLRAKIPNLALRTTLLVGHPGEGAAEFEELCKFVQEVKFDRLGVFPYSEEEGTFAANNLEDTLSTEEKIRRAGIIMKLQQKISEGLNADKVGKSYQVLIDSEDDEFYLGRTQYDSPEVDGEVLIKKKNEKHLEIGNFYEVEIVDSLEYDLIGRVK
ncbi:MAG TPA: 30S ribosomal protein S12 methylthiotransferase RimO [Williamwhitmania sp.]|nr:30S ribosomal protein S12 methylthiotransferase RimO [Williamwhitmania sp.]